MEHLRFINLREDLYIHSGDLLKAIDDTILFYEESEDPYEIKELAMAILEDLARRIRSSIISRRSLFE